MTEDKRQALIFYLTEARSRLIYTLIFLLILFSITLYFSNILYTLLALPLIHYLPSQHLIATQLVSPFFVPVKLAFVVSLMMTIPFLLYQLGCFIGPALYPHEKKRLWPCTVVGTLLFYLGMFFAYFVIFPLLFRFFAQVTPIGVVLTPDISQYLDFSLNLLISFGLLFEIPMLMFVFVYLNLISIATLSKYRGYAILAAFIIGMLLAPPDVLSQTVLAIPIYFLYEFGLLFSKLLISQTEK